MTRLHKIFLVYCLVALQLLTPFLHAHLWGKDTFEKTQGLHIHFDAPELSDADASGVFKTPTLKTDHSIEQSVGVLTGITGKQLTEPLPLPSLPWSLVILTCSLLVLMSLVVSKPYRLVCLLPPSRASP
jgi:hypothetical protein